MNWLEYEARENQKFPYIVLGLANIIFGIFLGFFYGGWNWLLTLLFVHLGIYGSIYKCNQIDELYSGNKELSSKEIK